MRPSETLWNAVRAADVRIERLERELDQACRYRLELATQLAEQINSEDLDAEGDIEL